MAVTSVKSNQNTPGPFNKKRNAIASIKSSSVSKKCSTAEESDDEELRVESSNEDIDEEDSISSDTDTDDADQLSLQSSPLATKEVTNRAPDSKPKQA